MRLKYCVFLLAVITATELYAAEQGIYISRKTIEDKEKFNFLLGRAKDVGITTFVIDVERADSDYAAQIAQLKKLKIRFVARIVVFPGGATSEQVRSLEFRESKYSLVKAAIAHGADEIQLDYIRYTSKQAPSSKNAEDILEVIKWFKQKIGKKIPLQIDVFGVAALKESLAIGQNLKLFAETVDVICPMVYPSHMDPYEERAKAPYAAVKELLEGLQKQFGKRSFRLVPFIEVFNFRNPMSNSEKRKYIKEQIRAANDAGTDGWYAWSHSNAYLNLFEVLSSKEAKR